VDSCGWAPFGDTAVTLAVFVGELPLNLRARSRV
jgi:hypothetical protein